MTDLPTHDSIAAFIYTIIPVSIYSYMAFASGSLRERTTYGLDALVFGCATDGHGRAAQRTTSEGETHVFGGDVMLWYMRLQKWR